MSWMNRSMVMTTHSSRELAEDDSRSASSIVSDRIDLRASCGRLHAGQTLSISM